LEVRQAHGKDDGMKILDVSAGNRAIWFDKSHRDALYIDVRPEVKPNIVADARALPAEIAGPFDLIVFDPPHENFGASGNMVRNYGHWTHAQIRGIVEGTGKEAHRVATVHGLRALKWSEHSIRLKTVLELLAPWWEPLFGHGVSHQQKGTSWVMLRRRAYPWELVA
jgi:hypothetical protein